MIPDAFASKYPNLASILMAIRSQEPANSCAVGTVGSTEIGELSALINDEEPLVGLLDAVFDGQPQPDDEFMRFSVTGFVRLGASEEARIFIGRLWADAIQGWDSAGRRDFLRLLLRDPHEVFAALDVATELFRRVQFTVDEIFPWILEAHALIANDTYQEGFWRCVEALSTTSPQAATSLAGRCLDSGPQGHTVVSNMLAWLRIAVRSQPNVASDFANLEGRLKAPGCPAWRAPYIQSWRCVGRLVLTEKEALEIRNRYVYADTEEETAWCFLLGSSVLTDKVSWSWAHRELMAAARPSLTDDAKRWAVVAALHGLEAAVQADTIHAREWRELLRALLPIRTSQIGIWQNIHRTLVSLAQRDAPAMHELVRLIAHHSAETWIETLQDRNFASFFHILKQKGLATAVCTDLCLASNARARHLGLVVFDQCGVEGIDRSVVHNATPAQLELLLLEAQRRPIGYGALARLHACLAERVDEIGRNLPELLYEEVSRQCMNTHEYRTALAAASPNNEYLQAILAEVEERLAAIGKASRSPALRMEAPGQNRAQKLHDRKLIRDVSKNIKQHSTFLNIFPTIHMLYGGMEPRIFTREGTLSPPVQMHSATSSVEVPRLECLDTEGMCLRRLAAAARVSALDSLPADEDDRQ
jgi:hypothetical protein